MNLVRVKRKGKLKKRSKRTEATMPRPSKLQLKKPKDNGPQRKKMPEKDRPMLKRTPRERKRRRLKKGRNNNRKKNNRGWSKKKLSASSRRE